MSETNDLQSRLRAHVSILSELIGERNTARPSALDATRQYIRRQMSELHLYVIEQKFPTVGRAGINLEVVLPGSSLRKTPLLIGAHYDTAPGTPGADDNASAAAILLEIIRDLSSRKLKRTVRCVLYDCEEPPHFNVNQMGSQFHARECRRRRDKLYGMICLESLGYYARKPQPIDEVPWFLRLVNRIIGGRNVLIVSNFGSILFGLRFSATMLTSGLFPVIPVAAPRVLRVIEFSDHRGYWNEGYRALMITNTALMRNPNYHESSDRLDTLDLPRMTRLSAQLIRCLRRMVGAQRQVVDRTS